MSDAPYTGPRLVLLRREGDRLVAATPSKSRAAQGVWHEQYIPLDPAKPITCSASCPRTGKPHWHVEAATALRDEYLTVRASQAHMSRRTLLRTAEDIHPENLGGVVTIAFLAAMHHLEDRGALPRQARAA